MTEENLITKKLTALPPIPLAFYDTQPGKPARKRPAVPPLPALVPEVAVEIATRAYFIDVKAGRPEGQEMPHRLEAEAQLTPR